MASVEFSTSEIDEWLINPVRRPYFALFFQAEYGEEGSTDTKSLGFATKPWFSALDSESSGDLIHYDDFVFGSPVIDYNLGAVQAIGDIDVINPEYTAGGANDWLDRVKFRFDGRPFRMMIGDLNARRHREFFDLVPPGYRARINTVRKQRGNVFRFDLSVETTGETTFHSSQEESHTGKITDIINTVAEQVFFIPAKFQNLTAEEMDFELELPVESKEGQSRADFVRALLPSFGPDVYLRQGPFQQFVIYRPDESQPQFYLTDDDIDQSSDIVCVSTERPNHAVRWVDPSLTEDQYYQSNTNATGERYTQPGSTAADRNIIKDLGELLQYKAGNLHENEVGPLRGTFYGNQFDTYSIKITNRMRPIIPGTVVSIDSKKLQVTGLCTRSKYTPATAFSTIEVRVRRSRTGALQQARPLQQWTIPQVVVPSGTVSTAGYVLEWSDNIPHPDRSYYAILDNGTASARAIRIYNRGNTVSYPIDLTGQQNPCEIRFFSNDDYYDTNYVQHATLNVSHA